MPHHVPGQAWSTCISCIQRAWTREWWFTWGRHRRHLRAVVSKLTVCVRVCICVYMPCVHVCVCVYKWMCAHGGQKLMSNIFHSPLYYFCLRQGLSQNLNLVISQGGLPAHQSYLSLPLQQQDSVLTNASEFSHGCLNSDSRLSCVCS